MKKFFTAIAFVALTFSLFTMAGCGNEVTSQCNMDNYSYTICHKWFLDQHKYTFEFLPGNSEQRKNPMAMPFYKKGVTRYKGDAHMEIENCIKVWEKMQ